MGRGEPFFSRNRRGLGARWDTSQAAEISHLHCGFSERMRQDSPHYERRYGVLGGCGEVARYIRSLIQCALRCTDIMLRAILRYEITRLSLHEGGGAAKLPRERASAHVRNWIVTISHGRSAEG